jgi:DNA-binding MarR family transcriptional regulator
LPDCYGVGMTGAQDAQQLTQRLGLRLSWHGSIAQARMKKALGEAGLTPRSAMTLMQLEAGPVGQRVLAERLEVDPSVVVGILNDLEGEGLVERHRDPADRRRHSVVITDAGLAVLSKTNAALDTVEDSLFARLSEEDRNVLGHLLDKIDSHGDDFTCEE